MRTRVAERVALVICPGESRFIEGVYMDEEGILFGLYCRTCKELYYYQDVNPYDNIDRIHYRSAEELRDRLSSDSSRFCNYNSSFKVITDEKEINKYLMVRELLK